MGTWDTSSFGNDTAADWAWEFDEAEDISPIEDALNSVVEESEDEDHIEAPTGEEGVAACEVLARLKGNSGERTAFTESIDKWVDAHSIEPSSEIVELANRVLDLVTSDKSELNDMWKETENFAEWQASILDLRQRLNS